MKEFALKANIVHVKLLNEILPKVPMAFGDKRFRHMVELWKTTSEILKKEQEQEKGKTNEPI